MATLAILVSITSRGASSILGSPNHSTAAHKALGSVSRPLSSDAWTERTGLYTIVGFSAPRKVVLCYSSIGKLYEVRVLGNCTPKELSDVTEVGLPVVTWSLTRSEGKRKVACFRSLRQLLIARSVYI